MSKLVRLEYPRDGVALLVLAAPEIGNFGSFAALDELSAAATAAREAGARVVVLASGLEDHGFEHAWLQDLLAMYSGETTSGSGLGWFALLEEMKRPEVVYMAAIGGDCSGGGAEIVWACDLRVVEGQVCFSQPEVQIHLATGVGGTCRLLRLIGATATAEMVLDGRPMTASRLHGLGAINRLVGRGEAVATAIEWAGHIASRPAPALRTLKEMLIAAQNLPLEEAMANEQRLFQELVATQDAQARMREIQQRFDRGETPRQVYGEPDPRAGQKR